MDDKKEARAGGGMRFQREVPATKKDLDLAIVVIDIGCRGVARKKN